MRKLKKRWIVSSKYKYSKFHQNQDIAFKREKVPIALAMASLYLVSFLINGGSKDGNMQIPRYKGQKRGKKTRIQLSWNICYAKKGWLLYEIASIEEWNIKDDDIKHLVNQSISSL